MKDAGAVAPIPYNASPPTSSRTIDFAIGDNRGFFTTGVAVTAAAAAAFGGAALIFAGGGGQVISPALITVAPRTTSSSMSTTRSPFFSGHMSSIKWRRFVA